MQWNLCMKNRVKKVQHQNTKNQTVIIIFPRYRTYLLICCVFHLKNDDTVLNALEIVEYHETTPVSEQFKWNDEKEKKS